MSCGGAEVARMCGARVALLVLGLQLIAAGPQFCHDDRLAGLDGLDGATGAAPAFMVGPMEAICKKAAQEAARTLPSSCHTVRDLLLLEDNETCEKLGAMLMAANYVNNCYCMAARAMADADEKITKQLLQAGQFASMAAPPPVRRAAPGLMMAAALLGAGSALAVRDAVTRRRRKADEQTAPLEIL